MICYHADLSSRFEGVVRRSDSPHSTQLNSTLPAVSSFLTFPLLQNKIFYTRMTLEYGVRSTRRIAPDCSEADLLSGFFGLLDSFGRGEGEFPIIQKHPKFRACDPEFAEAALNRWLNHEPPFKTLEGKHLEGIHSVVSQFRLRARCSSESQPLLSFLSLSRLALDLYGKQRLFPYDCCEELSQERVRRSGHRNLRLWPSCALGQRSR